MRPPVSAYRGPRPWRPPRTGAERLQLVALIQLVVVGLYAAGAAALVIVVAHFGGFCMDAWARPCGPAHAPSAAFDAAVALGGSYVVSVAALPVALAHLHRLGRIPLGAVVASLAVPVPAAYAFTALAG